MFNRFVVVGLAALLFSGEASAQNALERKFREVGVGQNKVVRLGAFGRLKPDCTAATLPRIVVNTTPATGVVSITEAMVNIRGKNPCAGRKVKLMVVIYQPPQGERTKDFVKFSVEFPDKTVEHNVSLVPRGPDKVDPGANTTEL